MKWPLLLPGCLLLLVTLTEAEKDLKLTVQTVSNGIKISCPKEYEVKKSSDINSNYTVGTLEYSDDNTGEYQCVSQTSQSEGTPKKGPKIFVKFRSCDNCVNLDTASIVGLIIGDVVATLSVGWAVYLITTNSRASQATSHHKSSARQHLIPNEVSSRSTNDTYQRLRPGRQIDTYDEINKR